MTRQTVTEADLSAAARQIRQKAARMIPPLLGQGPHELGPADRDALAIAMLADHAGWVASDVAEAMKDAALVEAMGLSRPVLPEVIRMGASVLLLARMMRGLLG